MMLFDEFVGLLDAAIRTSATVERFDKADSTGASWATRSRSVAVTYASPQNVSVALQGSSETPSVTWYPIDAALVPVVSKRIAGHLGEA